MPRRKLKGKGKFKEFLGKANNFLKKSQILSNLGNAYSKYLGWLVCLILVWSEMRLLLLNRLAMDDDAKDELDQDYMLPAEKCEEVGRSKWPEEQDI
jgi:hypothetical protein